MFAEYIDLVQKKSYVINIDKTEKTSMDNNKTVFLANAGGGGGGGATGGGTGDGSGSGKWFYVISNR